MFTQDIGTQANSINFDVQTQIEKGDFNQDIETQAEIVIMHRQTSLHSEDLEPLESGFSYGGDLSYLWSDFDFVEEGVGGDDDDEEYDEEEGEGEEKQQQQQHAEDGRETPKAIGTEVRTDLLAAEAKTEFKSDFKIEATTETETKTTINLSDLDESRRERMMDIGIQTGVLARVQHIYGGKGKTGPGQKQEHQIPEPGVHKITLRKDPKSRISIPSSSEPTLEKPGPSSASGPRIRTPLIPPPKLIESAKNTALHGRHWEKQQSVSDLRTRLEKARQSSQSSGNLWGSKDEGSTSSLQIFGTETASSPKPSPQPPSSGGPSATTSSTEISKTQEEEEEEKEEKKKMQKKEK
uniref:Uncharacterized protein n=1 Tax=Panagrolaimus superbus TaxID=310955 RepID=A0A914YVW1_9BILA